jgi:hypothetical protein
MFSLKDFVFKTQEIKNSKSFLYTFLFLPYFGNCGGKNNPTLMPKIFNNNYFIDE